MFVIALTAVAYAKPVFKQVPHADLAALPSCVRDLTVTICPFYGSVPLDVQDESNLVQTEKDC